MASLDTHLRSFVAEIETALVRVNRKRVGARASWRRMDLGTPIRAWRPPAQRRSLLALAAALAIVLTLAAVLTQAAQAQTYSVIYNFSGGQGGATPMAGLTSNGANSFY